ncbi:YdjC family protein [Emticicia oligotrophica DSM 17448]|uniref:YdjC family protein n=1 Tax=Emticicia oligotrophica (strain DSM 17448 / CIP 109782 / MTCC 6937 / GPTSA100-15) TaxID=929562 RepID=A0ABM5N6V7_EMTOG|nr:polysaccharide deacetylase family protein [Emticicia oligotrophica]AFK05279.1 YdjC family protein [Emticicia oligotrophica DSM 17448]
MKNLLSLILLYWLTFITTFAQTYAEKLGFPKGSKVVIMHVDDVGMSYDSNVGAIKAVEEGIATSMSVMMPCPWVPGFVHYLKNNPKIDAGLHLTLTSEWKDYRWGPLAGKPTVPNLVDDEGAMWRSVEETARHASADEIEKEIRSQLERARAMGFEPTHLDSHMGTLFARQDYLERYFKVGIENKIPVMFPGGHDTMIMRDGAAGLTLEQAQKIGKMLWNAGLPVLDDLHNISYGWTMNKVKNPSDKELQKYKTDKYIESFKDLQPGVTMVIMHCTSPTEVFEHISDSGNTRRGDMLAMLDPKLKKYIQDNQIILTTWRELKERRDKVK